MDVEICHVLLTIRRPCFQQIVSGVKKYEFRRRYVNQPSIAFVYVPTPVQAIRSVIQFGQPIVDSVEALANLAEADQSGAGNLVKEYFVGQERGVAVPIIHTREIKPISLYEIKKRFPVFAPPKAYIKLDNKPELLHYLQTKGDYQSETNLIQQDCLV